MRLADHQTMVGRYGTPVALECECGRTHTIWEAEVGERADPCRIWRVTVPVLHASTDMFAPSKLVDVVQGSVLRYDQRDYHSSWRHEGWDRFRVLDGPFAGTCVTVLASMPGSPVSAELAAVGGGGLTNRP